MKIVLVEIFNGNDTEAEAFKTVDSFKDYIFETFEDESEFLMEQLESQLSDGNDIIELADEYGVTIKAFTQYPIY
jgi:hypothetical protein